MRERSIIAGTVLALAVAGQFAACAAPTGATDMPPTATRAPSGETFQRFIVKYRDGSEPALRKEVVQARLDAKATDGVALSWQRRLGVQADVFTTSRPLTAGEAEALMRRFSGDPDVEYIEPDRRMGIAPIERAGGLRGDDD